MAHIIAVSNQKGGVGKTTVTVNLGKNLAAQGYRVLLVDNDPQGNLTMSIFGDELPSSVVSVEAGKSRPGLSNSYSLYTDGEGGIPQSVDGYGTLMIIGANKHLSEIATRPFDVMFEFKAKLHALRGNFDFILIDCLPSFGLLQTAAHMTADYLLIPTHLDDFSVKGISEQMKTANKTMENLNKDLKLLGILANEVSGAKVLVEEHFYDVLQEQYGSLLFKTKITKSAKVAESHALQKSVGEYRQYSDQARQYAALTAELIARIGVQRGDK